MCFLACSLFFLAKNTSSFMKGDVNYDEKRIVCSDGKFKVLY